MQIPFHKPHQLAGQLLQTQAISELRRDNELVHALITGFLTSGESGGEARKHAPTPCPSQPTISAVATPFACRISIRGHCLEARGQPFGYSAERSSGT